MLNRKRDKMVDFKNLDFSNSALRQLPVDPILGKGVRQVRGAMISLCQTTPVVRPQVILWSDSAAKLLDLDFNFSDLKPEERTVLSQIFSGNELLPGMESYATRYGGHQFGNWAGQLGDGRALYLGEITNSKRQKIEIQLKGAGPTPYSRTADGRAVFRSSVREFLCSEALFHLGIPTTRALSCTLSGEDVVRDMFYDGHPKAEPGAIVTRLAESFLRMGHFEILAAHSEVDNLKRLLHFAIKSYFPELLQSPTAEEDLFLNWFIEVCRRTASLAVDWTRVGFVHGVLNTDNTSVLGLTIDYGPYGWLEDYDPDWTPNTTDFSHRRYRFANQPSVLHWNLHQLGNALAVLFKDPTRLKQGLEIYETQFREQILVTMAAKIGGWVEGKATEECKELLQSLDEVMIQTQVDYTIFYRCLADWLRAQAQAQIIPVSSQILGPYFDQAFYEDSREHRELLEAWLRKYTALIGSKNLDFPWSFETMAEKMDQVNPYFVLRNYWVQMGIQDFEQRNDLSRIHQLFEALQTPYQKNPSTEMFFARRPEWARNAPGCSALSCSS
jgi:uncharacterized protein YdiU (UPF0061 family)